MKRISTLNLTLFTSISLILLSSFNASGGGKAFGLTVPGGHQQNHLITANSVGDIRLGKTVADARKALKGATLTKGDRVEDRYEVIVLKDEKEIMTLFTDQDDLNASIDDKAKIRSIRVFDSQYRTAEGIHPGSEISAVAKIYGTARLSWDAELGESLRFDYEPKVYSFGVGGDSKAGKYPNGAEDDVEALSKSFKTTDYKPTAKIISISVTAID